MSLSEERRECTKCFLFKHASHTCSLSLYTSIFAKAPLSYKLLFPFGTAVTGPAMFESESFLETARTISTLMDMSVSLLECELDALFGQLLEIGLEHANFPRVQANHWPMMQTALLQTLEQYSVNNKTIQAAWTTVFDQISTEMMETIKPMRRKSWDSSTSSQGGDSGGPDGESSASSSGWSQNR